VRSSRELVSFLSDLSGVRLSTDLDVQLHCGGKYLPRNPSCACLQVQAVCHTRVRDAGRTNAEPVLIAAS
jgi:hypothetical protein